MICYNFCQRSASPGLWQFRLQAVNLELIADFKVIDESPDWLVVDKPAPLIVHPTNPHGEPTLLDGVRRLLACDLACGAKPAVVNRLDRETSGLVVFAKHYQAARELGIRFERREVAKEYLAVVCGWPERDAWSCDEPILRAGEIAPGPIWVLQQTHPTGKPCRTSFRVERRFSRPEGRFSLLRCFPETGRMHQIRVHLTHCGFPIVGDKIYQHGGSGYLEWMRTGWTPSLQRKLLIPRQALHACKLQLRWQDRNLCWDAPLPADLQSWLDGLPWPTHPESYLWNHPNHP